MDTPQTWFVLQENRTYGPANLHTLQHWAARGNLSAEAKIGPAAEGPWTPARDLTELELDWQVIDDAGASYHPCHILALRGEVESGNIQPFWKVKHLPSGEEYTLVDALCSALLDQNRILEHQVAGLYAKVRNLETVGAEAAAAAKTGEMPNSPEDWSLLMRERDRSAKEAEKWKRFYDDEMARNQNRESELAVQLEDLRDQLRKSAERIKSLERRRGQLEELMVHPAGPVQEGGDRDLRQAYQEIRMQMELLLESLSLKDRELEVSAARLHQADEQLRTEQVRHQSEQRREQELQKAVRDQLTKVEQAHRDLIRSYRDLNERMIRLRNQLEAPSLVPLNRGRSDTYRAYDSPSLPPQAYDTASPAAPGRVKIKLT